MSLNADRFQETPSSDRAITRANKARRKAQRKKEKARAMLAEEHASRLTGFNTKSDNYIVIPLDDDRVSNLQRSREGFTSASGSLKSMFLGSTMESAMNDSRTKWFENVDPKTIVDNVLKLLCDEDMTERELEFSRKVGPYYRRDFKDWYTKVFEIYNPPNLSADLGIITDILNEIRVEYEQILGDSKLSALKPDDVAPTLRTDSSTGYPFWTKDWFKDVTIDGDITQPIEWARQEANRILVEKDDSWESEAVFTLFTRRMYRGMVDSPNLKSTERPVQCSSILERFLAGGIQRPLVKLQKQHFYSQGLLGDLKIGKPFAESFTTFDVAFEADYSNFDASIDGSLISTIFDVVIAPLFDEDSQWVIQSVKNHYASARLWSPLGVIIPTTVNGPGLMSGSMLTNVIGMIYGLMAWRYFVRKFEKSDLTSGFLYHEAFGYSDDLAVFFTCEEHSPEYVVSKFTEYVKDLGLTAHPEKQRVSYGHNKRCISFLGNVYFEHRQDENGCIPVYPIMRGLSKMIWHEFDKDDYYIDTDDYDKVAIDVNGMTSKQKDSVAIVGRISEMKGNDSFVPFTLFIREYAKLSYDRIAPLFGKAANTNPVLQVLRDADAQSPMDDGDNENVTPLSDDEIAEIGELLNELRNNPEAVKGIRAWKRRNAKYLKTKERLAKKQAYMAKLTGEEIQVPVSDDPVDTEPEQLEDSVDQPQPPPDALLDQEILKIHKVFQVAPVRKQRELLNLLRSFEYSSREVITEVGDDTSVNLF